MNIVFLGTSSFAIPILSRLVESSHTISMVVTQPDRPAGRGLKRQKTDVKVWCELNHVTVFQPENVNSDDSVTRIATERPQFIVVASYGGMIHKGIRSIAPMGCVNVHASLLPAYRGAAPVAHALIDGVHTTGVSIFRIVRELDAGPVWGRREMHINEGENRDTLERRLAHLGANLMMDMLPLWEAGEIREEFQDESAVSHAPKLRKEDGRIDWTQTSEHILRTIHAYHPNPGAFAFFRQKKREKRVVIHDAIICEGGVDLSEKKLVMVCGNGTMLEIRRLQPENKRIMSAEDFMNGYCPDGKIILT